MKLLHLLAFAIASLMSGAASAWPHGAKAAVVLSYDDALPSQLDHAVPALDAAGLKGSFFLSNVRPGDVPRWRAVARRGHELANHTPFHPCAAATYPADPRYTAEAYTPAAMVREIAQQEALLGALDGKPRHGFATPCSQTVAGGVDYLAPLRAAGIVTYVRDGTASAEDLRTPPARIDPMRVPARDFPESVTGEQLIAHARAAQAGGGLAVFVFHGVGGDHLQVSPAAHRALVAWLRVHRRDIWVTTLATATDWIRQRAPAAP